MNVRVAKPTDRKLKNHFSCIHSCDDGTKRSTRRRVHAHPHRQSHCELPRHPIQAYNRVGWHSCSWDRGKLVSKFRMTSFNFFLTLWPCSKGEPLSLQEENCLHQRLRLSSMSRIRRDLPVSLPRSAHGTRGQVWKCCKSGWQSIDVSCDTVWLLHRSSIVSQSLRAHGKMYSVPVPYAYTIRKTCEASNFTNSCLITYFLCKCWSSASWTWRYPSTTAYKIHSRIWHSDLREQRRLP